MNWTQANSIKDNLELIADFDFNQFKDKEYIHSRLKPKNAVKILEKFVYVYTKAYEDDSILSLSDTFRNGTNGANVSLTTTVKQINSYSKNVNHAQHLENSLLELQNFIFQSGLISLLNEKDGKEAIQNAKLLNKENTKLNKTLIKKREELDGIEIQLLKLKTELTSIKESEQQQLDSITKRAKEISEQASSISTLKTKSLEDQTEINKTLAVTNESIIGQKKDFNTFENNYKKLEKALTKSNEQTATLITQNEEAGSELSTLKTQYKELKEELDKLLDPAIAKNLLETFKKRKQWLFGAKIVWLIITGIIASIVINLAFQYFNYSAESGYNTYLYVLNGLKLIPFIILLGFCIRQFNRNRALEEEYAFRETIATSVTSYANQIKGDPAKKDALIEDTVRNLYASPLQKKTRVTRTDKRYLSDIKEIIKEAKEITNINIGGE